MSKLTWYIDSDENDDGTTGKPYLYAADSILVYELRVLEDGTWQAFNLVEGLDFKELCFTGTLSECMKHVEFGTGRL